MRYEENLKALGLNDDQIVEIGNLMATAVRTASDNLASDTKTALLNELSDNTVTFQMSFDINVYKCKHRLTIDVKDRMPTIITEFDYDQDNDDLGTLFTKAVKKALKENPIYAGLDIDAKVMIIDLYDGIFDELIDNKADENFTIDIANYGSFGNKNTIFFEGTKEFKQSLKDDSFIVAIEEKIK
jgi:hypothetical protein